jgi:5-methylcytosine-specific restriction endonuclease McrA
MTTVAEAVAHIEAAEQQRQAAKEKSGELRLKKFYGSRPWRAARFKALRDHGHKCFYCGASPSDGTTKLAVDHRLPLRHFWHLRLSPDNLVPACQTCNLGKGSTFTDDDRPGASAIEIETG